MMNKHIELGIINSLKVNRITEPGAYLMSCDEEEILLPNAYLTDDIKLDCIIDVFVYKDSEDRLVSTTLIPHAMKNEFAFLKVADIASFGAFVDFGLVKDLLVPKNKQRSIFRVGNYKIIKIIEDTKTNRLIGSEKFILNHKVSGFLQNDEIDILVFFKTPLGFKVIVNNEYEGLIYHNEIFQNVEVGFKTKAYIKLLREDGKFDVSLQKIATQDNQMNEDKVLEILKQNDGLLYFTYKSDALDIKNTFGISKKMYKATLTKLINSKKILLKKDHILINN